MIENAWGIIIATFFISLILNFFALKVFPKLGLLDRPQKYGLKRKPIPYYGGLVIYFSFLISLLIFLGLETKVLLLLLTSTVIMLLGFLDDYLSLSPILRIVVQIFMALLLFSFDVRINEINLPFIDTLILADKTVGINLLGFEFEIAYLSLFFTTFWILLIVNAMNFVDGVSGLSSGVGFVAFLAIFLIAVNLELHLDPASQIDTAKLSLILATTTFVFLLFDFPKAKILMGDTGSTFIGFLIATLSIYSGAKLATAFLVLGLPILDLIWVVVRRTFEGKKFWQGDLKHLHHRLLEIGMSEKQVVLSYLIITFLLGFASVLFVSSYQKFFMMIALLMLMTILAAVLLFLPRNK